MTRGNALPLSISVLIISTVFMNMSISGTHDMMSETIPVQSGSDSRAPNFISFSIENNTSLIENATLYGWTGSGTSGDPITIKNMEIDALGSGFGIKVSNTTMDLLINNVTIYNTVRNSDLIEDAGLMVINSSNVHINDSRFNMTENGIYSKNSQISISNSTFISNSNAGVIATGSEIVIRNNFINDSYYGIYLEELIEPVISFNNLSSNIYGLSLLNIQGGTVSNSTFHQNSYMGAMVTSSNGISFSDNGFFSNGGSYGRGISLERSNNIDIKNHIHLSENRAIDISSSNSNSILGSKISSCTYPIYLLRSNENLVKGNIIYKSRDGIYLSRSESNLLMENNISFIENMGIYVNSASYNTEISGNHLWNSSTAIHITASSDYVKVEKNYIENVVAGIEILYANYVYVYSNQVSNAENEGINPDRASYARIINNKITDTKVSAILAETSIDLELRGNIITGAQHGVEYNYCDMGMISDNHIENVQQGILTRGSDSGSIINNTLIECNSYGLSMSESNKNSIHHNNIQKSRFFGINILGSSSNVLWNNTLAYNNKANDKYNSSRPQASDNLESNDWSNNGTGNFWKDLTSPDDDINGIVDTPYILSGKANQDPYPLTTTQRGLVPSSPLEPSALSFNSRVELSWKKPTNDGGSQILKYSLFRKGTEGTFSRIAIIDQKDTMYVDTAMKNREEYSYYITALNDVGESLPSSTILAYPDDSVPIIRILTPSNGAFIREDEVYVSWNTLDPFGSIHHHQYRIDEGSWMEIGIEREVFLKIETNGIHTVSIRGEDPAGNWNISSISFMIDREEPDLDILEPLKEFINSTSLYIVWDMTDDYSGIDRVEVRWDDVYWLDKGMSTNITIKNLLSGPHTIYIKVIDKAGNAHLRILNYTIDLIAPELWLEYPDEGDIFNSSSVDIGWVGMDASSGMRTFQINIDDEGWTELGVVYKTTLTALSEGSHGILLKGIDLAGNTITVTLNFTVDTTIPEVLSYGPTGSYLDPNDMKINATFSETMDVRDLRFLVSGGVSGIVTWRGREAVFGPDETLAYGTTYQVRIDGSDMAGNRLETLTWSFTTDNRGTIRGQVLDPTNAPIIDAIISVDTTEEYRTDMDGAFSLLVESGEHSITIDAPGFISNHRTFDISPGEEIDLGQLKLDIRVDMGILKGRVVDEKDKPLFAVIVTLDTGDTVTTDENGSFTFDVPVGSYRISFNRDRYFRTTATATVNMNSITDIGDVKMTPTDPQQEDRDGGMDLWQFQIMIFIVILIIGIAIIAVTRKRSRSKVLEEE